MKAYYAILLSLVLLSCSGGGDEPGPKVKFKVVGDLARLDMNGTDRIPGHPDIGIPDIPPTMTKLFASYYVNDKARYLSGDVSPNGSDKFGFKRIDPDEDVTFTKIEGSPENRRYRINNASHVYFVNKSDTTALNVVPNSSQLIAFPNPESTAYLFKDATSGGYIAITLDN